MEAMPGDLVKVLSTPTLPEGEIARARLEDEGIPVLSKGGGEDPYRLGPVHLYVPAELEVQARLILSQTFEDEGDVAAEEPEDALEDDRGAGGPD
jgi:hypothetical protein